MIEGRRRDTFLLAAWTAGLGVCAIGARPLAESLRANGVLTATVWALTAASLLLVVGLLRGRSGQPSSIPLLPLLATAAAMAWLATLWTLPEERVHLAQYLPLGLLAWRALDGRWGAALALSVAIGLGDELLQGALPDRSFDPRDVLANAVAASAGLLLAKGGKTAWGAPALLAAARFGLALIPPLAPAVDAPAVDPFASSPPAAPDGAPSPVAASPAPQALAAAPYAGASVLFLTVDALRADRVPPWGHAAVPTPALDRLAAQSLALDARAEALWTTPGMVSFFTGLHPATHGVAGRGVELAPSVTTPLETLAAAGWSVTGFAGPQTETYRNLGFAREIDRLRPPEDVAVEELGRGRSFVWLHLREVHAPYDASVERLDAWGLPRPPASPVLDRARGHFTVPRRDFPGDHAWLQPALSALYDVEVADADAALDRILEALDAHDLAPVVVLSADHGEELLERGGVGHASTTLDSQPWPELVDIPLLLRFPDARRAGERAEGVVHQSDVLPSLLPLLGLRPEPAAAGVALDGRDLSAHWLEGTPVPPVPLLVHSSPCGWQCPEDRRTERVSALFDGRWQRCRTGCADPADPAAPADPRCAPACPAPLQDRLDAAAARKRRLGTPVASPPIGE